VVVAGPPTIVPREPNVDKVVTPYQVGTPELPQPSTSLGRVPGADSEPPTPLPVDPNPVAIVDNPPANNSTARAVGDRGRGEKEPQEKLKVRHDPHSFRLDRIPTPSQRGKSQRQPQKSEGVEETVKKLKGTPNVEAHGPTEDAAAALVKTKGPPLPAGEQSPPLSPTATGQGSGRSDPDKTLVDDGRHQGGQGRGPPRAFPPLITIRRLISPRTGTHRPNNSSKDRLAHHNQSGMSVLPAPVGLSGR
jgi:hypothetical protein